MFIRFCVSVLLLFASASVLGQEESNTDTAVHSCRDIKSCLALIPEITISESSAGEIDHILETKILSFGREALPHLVVLLEYQNPNVVAVSDSLIGKLQGLKAEDLPLVKEAIRKKRESFGWYIMSYFALATIGNQDAVDFLVEELRNRGNSPSQIGITFSRLGRKGIPALIELLQSGALCNNEHCIQVEKIFGRMEAEAKTAVPLLLEIAKDRERPLITRKMAIKSLGQIGVFAQGAGPDLLVLAHQQPDDFRHTVLWALVGMRHPLALDILNLDWDIGDDLGARLRDLASMREGAYAAGDKILDVLKIGPWDNKVVAARALGFIGYKPAVPELMKALNNNDDWRLSFVAAEALEMLMATEALKDLEKVAQNHWYPVVREAARKAYTNIKANNPHGIDYNSSNFAFDFFAFEGVSYDVEPCYDYDSLLEKINAKTEKEGSDFGDGLYETYVFGIRKFCQYDEEGEVISENECEEPKLGNYPNGVKKVEGGWLVFSDWGEWGGEIVFFEEDNDYQTLLNRNTEDIHFLEKGVFAITGLAHLFFNDGKVYQLKQTTNKVWKAVPIIRLPGAPNYSEKISDSEILIHGNGGSVIFNQAGTLAMAACEANSFP